MFSEKGRESSSHSSPTRGTAAAGVRRDSFVHSSCARCLTCGRSVLERTGVAKVRAEECPGPRLRNARDAEDALTLPACTSAVPVPH